jgi:hypothetical protein
MAETRFYTALREDKREPLSFAVRSRECAPLVPKNEGDQITQPTESLKICSACYVDQQIRYTYYLYEICALVRDRTNG